ncbi:hypothetical protein TREES_T100005309 [Tupaia chinensis]|uniref:Uncharacterized protein n=1 Tax=Tupaia chinensis TaxID=246437 RepID=L9KSL2_TUPCH|nr:hypothetical protein TREES_T100005309 [Tupaia chinensis]
MFQLSNCQAASLEELATATLPAVSRALSTEHECRGGVQFLTSAKRLSQKGPDLSPGASPGDSGQTVLLASPVFAFRHNPEDALNVLVQLITPIQANSCNTFLSVL